MEIFETLLEDAKKVIDKGNLADYIPELLKVDKNLLALSIVKDEGKIINFGDYNYKFTIQSISKIIALMVALLDRGEEEVFSKVGYQGTDDPFNSYYKLEENIYPLNPMMNAGAILTTSLIKEKPFFKILDLLKYITNNPKLDYSREVYRSESQTGYRNRGIFYILKSNNLIDKEENILEDYFKQCSIEVTCQDLAKIGYFFAHDCVRYDGDRRYEDKDMAKLINSIMLNCGMYDNSGLFARKVGLPSKSGVGGGIVSVVPGTMGIGVFSPALDKYGNSIAGVNLLENLSKELDLSIF